MSRRCGRLRNVLAFTKEDGAGASKRRPSSCWANASFFVNSFGPLCPGGCDRWIDFPLNAAFTNGLSMPGLVLELKQDELIIINGAAIRFRTKSRIEINGRARFLFGKQILLPAECNTPARSIYLALQTAYVGSEDERCAALEQARRLIDEARVAFGPAMDQTVLDQIIALAESGQSYEALKLARGLIRYEDALARPAGANAGTDRPIEESAIRQSARSS